MAATALRNIDVEPATLSAWFEAELAAKLAALPSDQIRYRCLIQQGNVWSGFYAAFAETGAQPFGCPHPRYGAMDALDFANVLASIETAKSRLEHHQEIA